LGTPTVDPSPSNAERCGTGSVLLNGGAAIGTSVFWFDQPSGGKLMGVGNTFNTPNIHAPNTATYYATSAKLSGDSALTTGFGGGNYAGPGFMGGNMFEVTILKTVAIDSLAVHLYLSNTQSVSIYMKQGTYNGFQFNPGAWTFIHKADVRSRNLGNGTYVKLKSPLFLQPGTYSFYIWANENLVFHAQPPALKTIGNSAIVTNHGIAMRDSFNTIFGGAYNWNGTFYYHEVCLRNNRVAVNATAKPLPVGAGLGKGTPFKGTYNAGLLNMPDVVANPDDITYQIDPPSGYLSSDYGTKWNITSIVGRTSAGNSIPSGDLSVTNPGSASGKVVYTPSSSYTDSMIRITMTVKSLLTNCDSVIERWIYVAPRPNADFINTTPCDGDPVAFSNKSAILKGVLTYHWNFGDGETSDLSDPEHVYPQDGNYNVELVVTSDYGYVDTFRQTISVSENPVADFDATNACEGTAVKLTDASTLPTGTTTHRWIMGDGSPDQTTNIASRQYVNPGIYPVTLVVSVNGCFSQVTKYVTQAPRGNLSFTADLGECDNADISFNNTSVSPEFGTVSYLWSFGDGMQQTGINATHSYNKFQAYNATLYSFTDFGCVDSAKLLVNLRESPKPAFTVAGSVCTGEDVSFSNITNVPPGETNTYSWDFGDAFVSSAANPVHRYPAAGDYTVKLKAVSTNGCEGEGEGQVSVEQKPSADFVVNKVCEGGVTEFTNNSIIPTGTLTYNWDLGNSTTSASVNPSVTYAAAGSYNIMLITTSAAGCVDTATGTAVVAAIPPVNIVAQSAGTGNGTLVFTTSSTGVTYKWLFGDGGSSEIQSPSYRYLIPGTWKVTLKVTSPDGCINSTSTDVVANPLSAGVANSGKLMVYPNPGSGIYYLAYSGNSPLHSITVTDMLGRVVAGFNPGANGETVIDLTSKTAGVYIITLVDTDGKLTTEKITLEK
ncbi:MAG TPA: PKD domain-containing protein, partial [Bacteroidia bacterium]|nr:PKD domain-containing protein [Bacteroidia bacterium]